MSKHDVSHSERCMDTRSTWTAEAKTFKAAHPDYCECCEGWGLVGDGTMDRDTGFVDRNPCPSCIDEGYCPWCCRDIDGKTRCECGWTDGAEGMPPEPECDCYDRWLDSKLPRGMPHEFYD